MTADQNNDLLKQNGFIKQKSFQEHLLELPTYNIAVSKINNLYSNVKDKNVIIRIALNNTETYVEKISCVAKPLVLSATKSALRITKPLVGEIKDPVYAVDNYASETLAKVRHQFPVIMEDPVEIAELVTSKTKETINFYYEKVQSSWIGEKTVKNVDSVLSLSEQVVDKYLDTEKIEAGNKELVEKNANESKTLVSRTEKVTKKAIRGLTKKFLIFRIIKSSTESAQMYLHRYNNVKDILIFTTNAPSMFLDSFFKLSTIIDRVSPFIVFTKKNAGNNELTIESKEVKEIKDKSTKSETDLNKKEANESTSKSQIKQNTIQVDINERDLTIKTNANSDKKQTEEITKKHVELKRGETNVSKQKEKIDKEENKKVAETEI